MDMQDEEFADEHSVERRFEGTVQADGTVLVQTSLARLRSASRNGERNYADPHTTSKTDL